MIAPSKNGKSTTPGQARGGASRSCGAAAPQSVPPIEKVLAALRTAVDGAKKSGAQWISRCPHHDDRKPSLTIRRSEDGQVLIHCHAGCSVEQVVGSLGLKMADLFPQREAPVRSVKPAKNGTTGRARVEKSPGDGKTFDVAEQAVKVLVKRHGAPSGEWRYQNAAGELVGVVLRWDDGNGKEIRPVSQVDRRWQIAGMPEPRPLYNLPEVLKASEVVVVEGEKCAEAAIALGLVATTNAHGSKAAKQTDWSPLAGKSVVIFPDNDEPGRRHAEAVARILTTEIDPPAKVAILEIPGLPKGGDVVDVIEDHHGDADAARAYIDSLAKLAVPVKPETVRVPNRLQLVNLAEVKQTAVQWLWPGRIAIGKVSVVAGDPGLGKSLLTADLAARVSRGSPWPDGAGMDRPGGVLLIGAEDDVADTTAPRLKAAGADMGRIVAAPLVTRGNPETGEVVDDMLDLGQDISKIADAIDLVPDCRLVVIDPISAYLGNVDSHKNSEVRALLSPLGVMAAEKGVAVLLVSHLNKSRETGAIYRLSGSLAFAAQARAVWVVARDQNDEDRRLFVCAKNNLSKDNSGLAYRVVSAWPDAPPVVEWEGAPVNVSANEALGGGDDEEKSAKHDAAEWLRDMLRGGPMPQGEIKRAAKAEEIAARTLDRAKALLGVVSGREGFGKDGRWVWSLPEGA